MSLNKVMLIGNVGADPEVRYVDSTSGTKVATLRIATTERYRDRDGNPRESTEWHNVVVWRNLADVVERYVKKGTQVFIEGRLRTRSWEDQNGVRKYVTEVVADNLQLLGRRPEGQGGQGGYQGGNGGYQGGQGGYRQGGYQGGGYGGQQSGGYGGQQYGSQSEQPQEQQPTAQPQIPSDEDDDDLPF